MSDFECRACDGNGWTPERRVLTLSGSVQLFEADCRQCHATGWVNCDRGGVECPFGHCYCEAAWDRQQEANASEPPPTARERQEQAQRERDALRSGRAI